MKKKLIPSLMLSLILLVFATPAYAVPALPHAFYGTVEINGSVAPDGSTVSAVTSDGTVVATQNPVTTSGGSYGIASPKLLVQGDIPNGAMVYFYVNGVDTGETTVYSSGGGPTAVNLGVSITVPAVPEGDSNGGGGTLPTIKPDLFGIPATIRLTSNGLTAERITASSDDGLLTIDILCLTEILDVDGDPQTTLTVEIDASPPSPPEDTNIIGLVYDFGPDGTTFSPPMEMVWEYDPGALVEGTVEGNLVIAYYNGNEWVTLEGVVDEDAHTITALVDHFTEFAIIAEDIVAEEPVPVPPVITPVPVPAPAPVPAPTPAPPVIVLPAPLPSPAPVPVLPPTPPAPAPLPLEPERSSVWLWSVVVVGIALAVVVWLVVRRQRAY